MFDWLKINKDYPDFWKAYQAQFHEKATRYVALSLQTTGQDYLKDVILSIGALGILDGRIHVGDSFEVVLLQYVHKHDNEFPNDFIRESSLPKLVEPEAVKQFVEFLGNAIVIGHRVNFDMEILNEALNRIHCGRLRNEALDIEVMYRKWKDIATERHFSLDELAQEFNIPLTDRISTAEEAYLIGLIFQKLSARLDVHL